MLSGPLGFSMSKHDTIRLRHMLDAAREAQGFARGRQRADLDSERMLVQALIRCIEVIGEAAAGVGAEVRTRHPQVPWASIVGMRNRLIHAYFDVDLNRVWDTLTDDLPPLIRDLERIVLAEESSD
jgi:uncharacterized protein with HEPN domain